MAASFELSPEDLRRAGSSDPRELRNSLVPLREWKEKLKNELAVLDKGIYCSSSNGDILAEKLGELDREKETLRESLGQEISKRANILESIARVQKVERIASEHQQNLASVVDKNETRREVTTETRRIFVTNVEDLITNVNSLIRDHQLATRDLDDELVQLQPKNSEKVNVMAKLEEELDAANVAIRECSMVVLHRRTDLQSSADVLHDIQSRAAFLRESLKGLTAGTKQMEDELRTVPIQTEVLKAEIKSLSDEYCRCEAIILENRDLCQKLSEMKSRLADEHLSRMAEDDQANLDKEDAQRQLDLRLTELEDNHRQSEQRENELRADTEALRVLSTQTGELLVVAQREKAKLQQDLDAAKSSVEEARTEDSRLKAEQDRIATLKQEDIQIRSDLLMALKEEVTPLELEATELDAHLDNLRKKLDSLSTSQAMPENSPNVLKSSQLEEGNEADTVTNLSQLTDSDEDSNTSVHLPLKRPAQPRLPFGRDIKQVKQNVFSSRGGKSPERQIASLDDF